MINECYNTFVELSTQQCLKNDYKDSQKVKKHNDAYGKLLKLMDVMSEENCDTVLDELLVHNDDRVRINAALLCFQTNVHKDKAIQVLKRIVESSNDSTIVFSAKNLLNKL